MIDTVNKLLAYWAKHPDHYLRVGIDPGVTGGVAFLLGQSILLVDDAPVVKVKKKSGTRSELNVPAIAEAFLRLRPLRGRVRVAIEEAQVQIRGKHNTNYTSFRVGVVFGTWLGVLGAMDFSVEKANPAVWKRAMGLTGKDKEASRLMALGLWPRADLQARRHHNRAEAALIAEWLRRRLEGE